MIASGVFLPRRHWRRYLCTLRLSLSRLLSVFVVGARSLCGRSLSLCLSSAPRSRSAFVCVCASLSVVKARLHSRTRCALGRNHGGLLQREDYDHSGVRHRLLGEC